MHLRHSEAFGICILLEGAAAAIIDLQSIWSLTGQTTSSYIEAHSLLALKSLCETFVEEEMRMMLPEVVFGVENISCK